MDSEQKEVKAENKRPKMMKVQPKRWPKKRMERGYKKCRKRAKEGCPKGTKVRKSGQRRIGKYGCNKKAKKAENKAQGSQPGQRLSE